MMISVRGLTKQFTVSEGRVTAIKGLDLDVEEGEFFVIVGASGSGKTTLLRSIAGLERPERGEIRIAGEVVCSDNPPTWVPPQQRKLGMVFQSYAVWPHLTVFENVALPLTEGAQRIPRREVTSRVNEALRMVELEAHAARPAPLLSGGQQQRVALARAIAVNSPVLLMDEPLSNLDARLREDVRGKIRELAKELGATVLYVTHDQVEAMAVADKIAVMQLGEVLQVGAPTDLYHRPRTPEVAEFFGSVNWIKGRVAEPELVETPLGPLRVMATLDPGAEVVVGFRPEGLSIAEGPPRPDPNIVRAKLSKSTFLGDQFVFEAVVGDQRLLGKCRKPIAVHDDGHFHLSIDSAYIFVFPQRDSVGHEMFPAPAAEVPEAAIQPVL